MFGSVAIISGAVGHSSCCCSWDSGELMEIGVKLLVEVVVSCPWFNLLLFDDRLMMFCWTLVVDDGGCGGHILLLAPSEGARPCVLISPFLLLFLTFLSLLATSIGG